MNPSKFSTPIARATILALLSILSAFAQSQQREYLISVGATSEKVTSGTLWLYGYSLYGLNKIQLGVIRNGRASVSLDSGKLKRELDPNSNTEGYVVVLQTGEHVWYRSPNIQPDSLWSNLSSAVNSLGQATESNTGQIQLVLPPLTKRHITLLYPNGQAATNWNITLSIYLWNTNHCGFHQGLPLGTFRTNKAGTLEVSAPLVAIYIEEIRYYQKAGTGLRASRIHKM